MSRTIGWTLVFQRGTLKKMYWDGIRWKCLGIWNKDIQDFEPVSIMPKIKSPLVCYA